MLFNSVEFIFIFLPLTFFIYFGLNKIKLIELSKGFLVFASLVFYSWWNIAYLPLILCSMLFNYAIGSTLNNHDNIRLNINRKLVLIFAVTVNLALLGYYKYFDFFITNTNAALGTHVHLLHLILPLGISFFTFTQIAYLVDAYKREVRELDLLNYALFVTFFPHLIAGPILHHSEMMPQFAKLRNKIINHKNITIGIVLFTIGLIKKIIIADSLSSYVTLTFDIIPQLSFFQAWIASLSYTFQLYFDFSGYTDMALGIGYMFNIILPKNFNSPYKAINIQDFWRRWHMTLSRFLKDYVYIPLGGNRIGNFNTYRNLFLTFFIGGIWHGASWTFIIWGTLHGMAIVFHRWWKKFNIKIPQFLALLTTFLFVNFAWVFFRAKTFEDAAKVFKGMIGLNGFDIPKTHHLNFLFNDGALSISWLMFLIAFVIVFGCKNSNQIVEKFKPTVLNFIVVFVFFMLAILNINKISEFLYFQF